MSVLFDSPHYVTPYNSIQFHNSLCTFLINDVLRKQISQNREVNFLILFLVFRI